VILAVNPWGTVLGSVSWLLTCLVVAAGPTPGPVALPDLAVVRPEQPPLGDALLVTVLNRGTARAEAFDVRVMGAPLAPSGLQWGGRHDFGPTEGPGWALWAEPGEEPDTTRLQIRWVGGPGFRRGGFEMQLADVGAYRVAESSFAAPDIVYTGADGAVNCQASGRDADKRLVLTLNSVPPQDPLIVFRGHTEGQFEPQRVWIGARPALQLPCRVRLSDLLGPRVPEPIGADSVADGLAAGGSLALTIPLSAPVGFGGAYVVVDPDNRLTEARKGNNVAHVPGIAGVVACQFHARTCFGLTDASMDTQMWRAAASGTDLVVAVDEDWRLLQHSYASASDFEGDYLQEVRSVGTETLVEHWTELGRSPGFMSPRTSDDRCYSGERSLEIAFADAADNAVRELSLRWETARDRLRYPLAAGVTVSLWVYPEDVPPDACLALRFALSSQADGHRDVLTYAVGGDGSLAPDGDGAPILAPWIPGQWNRVELRLTEDAKSLLTAGADNAITDVVLSVRTGQHGGRVFVDAIRIAAELSGDALDQIRRSWLDHYPNLVTDAAVAAAYYSPQFVFLGDVAEPIEAVPGDQAAHLARAAARSASNAGLVVLSNPPGAGTGTATEPLESAASWQRARLFGAQVAEVGYRAGGGQRLGGHLAFWDSCLAQGLDVVGIGVSGVSAGAVTRRESNFVTWVRSPVPDLPTVLRSLRAGRAWFGDPLAASGPIEITASPGEFRTGSIVLTDWNRCALTLSAEGLPPDAELFWVSAGERTSAGRVPSGGGTYAAALDLRIPKRGTAVRAEAYDREGLPLVFSNAITFLRELPAGTDALPADRGGIALGEWVVHDVEGFSIAKLVPVEGGVDIHGAGARGGLTVACGQKGPPASVRTVSQYGVARTLSYEWTANTIRLDGLTDRQVVQIRWPGEPKR